MWDVIEKESRLMYKVVRHLAFGLNGLGLILHEDGKVVCGNVEIERILGISISDMCEESFNANRYFILHDTNFLQNEFVTHSENEYTTSFSIKKNGEKKVVKIFPINILERDEHARLLLVKEISREG